ncbi:MAG: cation:proton antiporter, partial [Gemmatimonadota bacterium]
MVESAAGFFSSISLTHLNMLLLLGLALSGGTIGGRLFQKLRIPQVVGYIMVGVLVGQTGLGMVDQEVAD